eukprot:SAG31_NODE_37974_length_300_cov_0.696517_1_plen_28_part_10
MFKKPKRGQLRKKRKVEETEPEDEDDSD